MGQMEVMEMEQEQSTEFVVDNDSKADWAVKKIKEAEEERDRLLKLCDAQIEELNKKRQNIVDNFESDTSWFRGQLMAYMATVKVKQTKTQDSYQLISGKLVRKNAKLDFTHDDAKLIDWAQAHASEYVKTTYKLDWAAFKKGLQITDDGSVINEDGEILEIDGLGVAEKPATFSIV